VLVGHSFGGTVACVIAANNPEVVRSLVLTGAPLLRSLRHDHRDGLSSTEVAPRSPLVRDARLEAARQKYGSRDYRDATASCVTF